MRTKIFVLLSIMIISSLFLFIFLSRPVLFYSISCSHCQYILKYIEDQGFNLWINKKEIRNIKNLDDFYEVNQKCNLKDYFVPLLYVDSKCYVGDVEIKNFLIKK